MILHGTVLAVTVAAPAAVTAAAELLRGRSWVALSGAGMSTDSGIPDYRGPTSVRATPMQYSEFVGSADAQRRYWARSYLGWRRIGRAEPNPGHRALADLEAVGLTGVITQNVDGLHSAAGSSRVINLHGDIASVVCLECGDRSARSDLQHRLRSANPQLDEPHVLEHAELRPDGDAVVRDWRQFRLIGCVHCGGRLKPDVVFFGESVPRPRVEAGVRAPGAWRGVGGLGLVTDGDVRVAFRPAQREAATAGCDHQSRRDPGRRARVPEDRSRMFGNAH